MKIEPGMFVWILVANEVKQTTWVRAEVITPAFRLINSNPETPFSFFARIEEIEEPVMGLTSTTRTDEEHTAITLSQ